MLCSTERWSNMVSLRFQVWNHASIHLDNIQSKEFLIDLFCNESASIWEGGAAFLIFTLKKEQWMALKAKLGRKDVFASFLTGSLNIAARLRPIWCVRWGMHKIQAKLNVSRKTTMITNHGSKIFQTIIHQILQNRSILLGLLTHVNTLIPINISTVLELLEFLQRLFSISRGLWHVSCCCCTHVSVACLASAVPFSLYFRLPLISRWRSASASVLQHECWTAKKQCQRKSAKRVHVFRWEFLLENNQNSPLGHLHHDIMTRLPLVASGLVRICWWKC